MLGGFGRSRRDSAGSRWQRIGALWLVTAEGLLALLFVAGALAAWFGDPADQPDNPALFQYASLVAVLSVITRISVSSGIGV